MPSLLTDPKKHSFFFKIARFLSHFSKKLIYDVPALRQIHIYKRLAWLNGLPQDEAEDVFAECCGSHVWARRMAMKRPFPMLGHLFMGAESAWVALSQEELNGARGRDSWVAVEARLAELLER